MGRDSSTHSWHECSLLLFSKSETVMRAQIFRFLTYFEKLTRSTRTRNPSWPNREARLTEKGKTTILFDNYPCSVLMTSIFSVFLNNPVVLQKMQKYLRWSHDLFITNKFSLQLEAWSNCGNFTVIIILYSNDLLIQYFLEFGFGNSVHFYQASNLKKMYPRF